MRRHVGALVALAKPLSIASTLALLFGQPAWAGATYQFVGTVTQVPTELTGPGGLALGDPVHLSFTVGSPVADTDPAGSVGSWIGAIASWTLSIGAFAETGSGGDVLVCDAPAGSPDHCGSSNNYGFFGSAAFSPQYLGKDAVRFVGFDLTSAPFGINGFTQSCGINPNNQCANANVYDDLARLTDTAIPGVLDPSIWNSSVNNGRIPFPVGNVLYSVAAVPEPATLALLGLGLAGLAATRRRKQ